MLWTGMQPVASPTGTKWFTFFFIEKIEPISVFSITVYEGVTVEYNIYIDFTMDQIGHQPPCYVQHIHA